MERSKIIFVSIIGIVLLLVIVIAAIALSKKTTTTTTTGGSTKVGGIGSFIAGIFGL